MRILFLAAIASVIILAPVNASHKHERSDQEEQTTRVTQKPKSELPRPDSEAFNSTPSRFRGFISRWEEVKDKNGFTDWKNISTSSHSNILEEIDLTKLSAADVMTITKLIKLHKSASEK